MIFDPTLAPLACPSCGKFCGEKCPAASSEKPSTVKAPEEAAGRPVLPAQPSNTEAQSR